MEERRQDTRPLLTGADGAFDLAQLDLANDQED